MSVMSKHKKQTRSGVSLGVYIAPELMASFAAYVDEAKPRTSKTAVIEMLLERFLTEQGRWPPPTKDPKG